jgi:hypothetical protein
MDKPERKHIHRFSVAINDKGERVIMPFIDGEFYTQKTSTHDVCKGRMTFHQVSERWSVLRCATCNLRVYLPADNLSEMHLLAWLKSQTTEPCIQVPCGACGKTDDDFCYVCNEVPPKIKEDKNSGNAGKID